MEVLVFLHNPSKMVTFHLKGFYLTEGKIDDTSLAQHFLWILKMAKYNDVVVTIEIAPLSIPYYGCNYLEKFQLDSGSVRYILTRCDICLSPPNKQFERDQLCCQFFVASTKLSKRRKSWISILWKAPIIWITKCAALCTIKNH